jgi:large subunit ribosomal protein L7/L12
MSDFSYRIQLIGDEIANLSVKDLPELTKYLAEVHGIHCSLFTGYLPPGPVAGDGVDLVPEGRKVFNVVLQSYNDKKIAVIKAVRSITGVGLKEAKDLVESLPQIIKHDVELDEARRLKLEIEECGGTVSIV